MKLVIGCLNSKYIHASSAPWCLAAGIREFAKTEIEYTVVESTINSDLEAYAQTIIDLKPDTVSFCCYIWNINQTLFVCEKIKNTVGSTLVLGGPEVAFRAKDVLSCCEYIDYVISGEGEFVFPEFSDMLNGVGEKQNVAGLTYRDGDNIFSVEEKCYTETPPSPFSDEYFAALGGRICYIESSRGCPYRCAFCLSGRVSKLRFFDMQTVKRDLLLLAKSGSSTVKFVDRTFNADEKRANEILCFIKDNYGTEIPHGVCFHFEIAGDILKASTLQILSEMPVGAVQLEIGMQSFNAETLAAINRKTDTEKLVSNIKTLVGFGNMHIHIDLIAGLTGEDITSFEKSFNIAYALKAHMLQLGFLKLLYGADMREHSEKYPCTFTDSPPYEVTATPWLSANEIAALKKCEDALDRLYNSGRFLFTLDYLINVVGFTPFRLFCEFGNAVNGKKIGLGEYAAKLFGFFENFCDREILREKIVCDMLCCGSESHIPREFKTITPLHKKAKNTLENGKNLKIAVLQKSNLVFAADPQSTRDFFGRYQYKFYDLTALCR